MKRREGTNMYQFYYHYYVLKESPKVIQNEFKISRTTYHQLLAKLETLNFDITTGFLEKELMLQYHITTDTKEKFSILKEIREIWKVKHKVPSVSKEADLDLSILKNMGDPTAKTA